MHETPQWVGLARMSTHDPPHRPCPEGQLLAQAGVPSARQPNMHGIIVDGMQVPVPLHRAAVVAVPPMQLAPPPQDIVAGG